MIKKLIRVPVLIIWFVLTVIIASKIMNKDHDNITMEMTPASFPLLSIVEDDVTYNCLHGYAQRQSVSNVRDTVTVLGENREIGFVIDRYDNWISKIEIEVRSADGERLVEHTEQNDYVTDGDRLVGTLVLKDLLEPNTDYSLEICVTADSREIYYYTTVNHMTNVHAQEKMDFVLDFHERLFDKEEARSLTKYLETNSAKNDNSSFHYVDIYSSFAQLTYGNLEVIQVGEPTVYLKEMAWQTASYLVEFEVRSMASENPINFRATEYYRVRYTEDRMYLLEYERYMTQIPVAERMCVNDKIVLGIADENVVKKENADGSAVAFVTGNVLWCYNSAGKLARVFSFYDKDNNDKRTTYSAHNYKILDIDEAGNVQFAVYGYMNRGRHEGEVGIELYSYDYAMNTIEELIYIPYNKSSDILEAEIDRLLYLNRDKHVYLSLEDEVFEIDLVNRTATRQFSVIRDDTLQTSKSHRIIVSQVNRNDSLYPNELRLINLMTERSVVIDADAGDVFRVLGFMGEDLIYGIAHESDLSQKINGELIFPMYKVCICDDSGNIMKEYSPSGIFVTDCTIYDNQITLYRMIPDANGTLKDTTTDSITDNSEEHIGKILVSAPTTELYEKYVQIKVLADIDTKKLGIVTPKEVVYEGGRSIDIETTEDNSRYYVYTAYGVAGLFDSPGLAVKLAYEKSGAVYSSDGTLIWRKGNRDQKNQIMAIEDSMITEDKNSLVICLDTILKYNGIIRNTDYLLSQGQTVMEILETNLPECRILNLSGCTLDAVLYYVNRDIPVMVNISSNEYYLIVGFNSYNIVLMDPFTGTTYKKGINDADEWFTQNGNTFLTYVSE